MINSLMLTGYLNVVLTLYTYMHYMMNWLLSCLHGSTVCLHAYIMFTISKYVDGNHVYIMYTCLQLASVHLHPYAYC